MCITTHMKKSQLAFKKLRELISEAKGHTFSQSRFADVLGISRDTVASIEAGRLDVSPKMKDRILYQYGVVIVESSEHPKRYADEFDDDLELQLLDYKPDDFKNYTGPSLGLQILIPSGTKELLGRWLDCLPADKRPIACIELQKEMERIFKELTGKKWKDPNEGLLEKEGERTLKRLNKMLYGPLERAVKKAKSKADKNKK